jgi:anti-sigma regulatory factor (Ser/Thr protein kinase)
MTFHYTVSGTDFSQAGSASADIKKKLQMLGIPVTIIKRTAVAMYEAEINMVVHAGGGEISVDVTDTEIVIVMADHGPGIPDIELAMQEGYSTAPEMVQELGFGAGMGLPNMKRNSDFMTIDSKPGEGTTVTMRITISDSPEANS